MKRLLSVFLALALLFCFVSCGGNDVDNNEQSDSTEEVVIDQEEKKFEYKDGYAIVTYHDIDTLISKKTPTNVCVVGIIKEIDQDNKLLIEDSTGGKWSVEVGTDRQLSEYVGTTCEVYGSSTGKTYYQQVTPLININNSGNKIRFNDSKELDLQKPQSIKQFKQKVTQNNNSNSSDVTVWIPTNGGKKYHSRSTCSGMNNPKQASKSEAISQGFTQCSRCW